MFEIIGAIVIIYGIRMFCDALENMAKNYETKINNGWIDCRSI